MDNHKKLIRTIIIVHGDVQTSNYRGRIIKIAKKMDVTGTVQNLINGNVKIIAEGEKSAIESFCNTIQFKDYLIHVTKVDRDKEKELEIDDDEREYEDFYKIVGEGETDERLDRASELLKDLVIESNAGFKALRENIKDLSEDIKDLSIDQRDYIKKMEEHNLILDKILEKLTER